MKNKDVNFKDLEVNAPAGYPAVDYHDAFDEIYQTCGERVDFWMIKLAHLAMLPKALRPPKEKMVTSLGLTSVTNLDNWLRHPKILMIKKILTKRYFKDVIPDILLAMQNQALMGDVPAAKLFLSYIDDFDSVEQKNVFNQVNVTADELGEILSTLKNKKV